MSATDERKNGIFFEVDNLKIIARIYNEFLAGRYGRNVSDTDPKIMSNLDGQYQVLFTFNNWLEGDDAQDIRSDLAKTIKKLGGTNIFEATEKELVPA